MPNTQPFEKVHDTTEHQAPLELPVPQDSALMQADDVPKGRLNALVRGPYAFPATILIAFCESSFFPVPPDIGFIPILMHDRSKAWLLAAWATVASVLGGIVGYMIGAYLFDWIGEPILQFYGLTERFSDLRTQFHQYGFLLLILKGLTPIPYKLMTLSSGVFGFSMWQFIVASIIARGGRFFMLSAGLWYLGPRVKNYINRFLGWIVLIILIKVVVGVFLIQLL